MPKTKSAPNAVEKIQLKSQYQTVDWTSRNGTWTLRLNGGLQVHSKAERREHEGCATVPMMLARNIKSVLILGGGDGFSARNALEFDRVGKIVNVELCPAMLKLFGGKLKRLNDDAFHNPKVEVLCTDAIAWLFASKRKFDVIINDLEYEMTDQPADITAALIYRFNQSIFDHLADGGIFTTSVGDTDGTRQLDALFAEHKAQVTPAQKRAYARSKDAIDRSRVLLGTLYPHLAEWDVDDPHSGRQVNFYGSKAPFEIHRQPRIPPQYATPDVLKKILK